MSNNNIYSYREEIKSALAGVPEGERKELFSKLIEFSKMQTKQLLDLSDSNGISAAILRDFGIDTIESAPDDSQSIEIEEYMQEVEKMFNDRLDNIQISSIKYIKGNGGVECTKNNFSRLPKNIDFNINVQNGIKFNDDNSIEVQFDLPGVTNEHVIITFESNTDDELLNNHDLIVLKNLLQGRNIAGLIEEKSKKIKEKYSDGMTGLFNSTYFSEILSRPNHDYSGIFIDISLFKQINDENGQNFGDEAIKQVALFLEGSVRPNDKVVRIGGDEFFILFNNGGKSKEENTQNIQSFLQRLNEDSSDLSLYNKDSGKTVQIGLKYGYAVSEKSDSQNADALVRIANDMLNDDKNPEGKAYRILSMFKELKEEAIIPTIKFLIGNKLFTDKFFPSLFETQDEGDYFFNIFHSIIYDKMSELGKLNITPEQMSHMREYLEYIQLFRTKSDDELRDFFAK